LKTSALAHILGKTVTAAIVSEYNASGPPAQLFIVFDDGTALEVYGQLQLAGSLHTGGEDHVRRYAELSGGRLTHIRPAA
jgi:hypothetical protein